MIGDPHDFASFVPYRERNGEYEYYLQMREKHKKRSPGVFGMFGGVIEEGETPEVAVIREVQEELAYVPANVRYIGPHEQGEDTLNVFVEEVGPGFEAEVEVLEGEYGKFLTLAELLALAEVSEHTRAIIPQVDRAIRFSLEKR
jgi:8-oxo-dGTP pyrophosphatase MutT (NUDIX family)